MTTPAIPPVEKGKKETPLIPHVWLFNNNRRIYPPAPPRKLWASSGPIYREHWEKHDVIGQTSRSWITKYAGKIPKLGGHGIAFTEQEVNDDVWIHDNRHLIARAVNENKNAETLREIAKLLNLP